MIEDRTVPMPTPVLVLGVSMQGGDHAKSPDKNMGV
jgi:hypothetical protein